MKKVLSVILVLAMLTMSFTACGKKASTNTGVKATEAPTTDVATDPTEAPEETVDISTPVTLKWYLEGSNVTDDAAVMEKVNAYLKEKLNVTLEPIWASWGDFEQNVNLSIDGGEDVDIYFTCSWTPNQYMNYAKKGAYVQLDDPNNNLIEKYAKDLWATLPEVLTNGAKVEGSNGTGVYAVPGYKDIATQNCWDVNVTLLEKYGYTIDDIKNTDYYGFGDILKKVKEGEGKDFYPLLVEGAVLERMVTNSMIITGDSTTSAMLSYYLDPTDTSKDGPYPGQILSKYETPEYKKFVEKTREYYLAGYIDPAMANPQQANDTRTTTQNAAKYLIGTQSYAYGFEVSQSTVRGIKVEYVPTTPAYVDTTSSQGAMMAISTRCQNPERAMMFLNLLNTDPELMTLLAYGVEGVHYDKLDTSEIKFTDKHLDYQPWVNGLGNITLLPPLEGQGANFVEDFKAFYGSAKSVPLLGWAFNVTPVETEMGALANVGAEFSLALNVGAVDPATELPKFIEKLKANGIDKVVTEANTQLSAWSAAK